MAENAAERVLTVSDALGHFAISQEELARAIADNKVRSDIEDEFGVPNLKPTPAPQRQKTGCVLILT